MDANLLALGVLIGTGIGSVPTIMFWMRDKRELEKRANRLVERALAHGYSEGRAVNDAEIDYIEDRLDQLQETVEDWMGYSNLPKIGDFKPIENRNLSIEL